MSRRDTRLFMGRRIGQRFRDARFIQWSVMKRRGERAVAEADADADDDKQRTRVMVSVVPKNESIAFLLSAIEAVEVAIHAVYSPALLALRVVRAQFKLQHALVMSWEPGGLRQTVVRHGEVTFSRLAPIPAPISVSTLANECLRTVQYLLMSKQVNRAMFDSGAMPICLLQGGIAEWSSLPDALSLEAGLTIPIQRVPADWLSPGELDQFGSLPIWGAATRLPSVLGSSVRGYADQALVQRAVIRTCERLGWWSGVVMTAVAASLLLGTVTAQRLWPAETPEFRTQLAAAELASQNLRASLAEHPVGGYEMQKVADLSAQLRVRHVEPIEVMSFVAVGLDTVAGLELQRLRWRRLDVAQRADWKSADAGGGQVAKQQSLSGASQGLGGGSAPLGAGQNQLPPLGASPSVPLGGENMGAVPAGGPAQGAESFKAWLGPVVVEIQGRVSGEAPLEDSNQRVLALQRAIRARCGCEVHVVKLPYDPESATGFTRQLEKKSGDDASGVGEFTLRLLLDVPPPVFASAPAPLSTVEASAGGGLGPGYAAP